MEHKCGEPLLKHFSSESKKQQETNYREFSPTHAVTYVALSKN